MRLTILLSGQVQDEKLSAVAKCTSSVVRVIQNITEGLQVEGGVQWDRRQTIGILNCGGQK